MKPDKKNRVIVDVNIWISYLIGRRLQKVLDALVSPTITLVFSIELLEELHHVTQRPKFAKYFSDIGKVSELLEFLSSIGEMVDIPELIQQRCRDPKDDYLLELAIVSDADFLITGDKDLLDIKKIGNCQIVTAMEFDIYSSTTGHPTLLHEGIEEYYSIVIGE